MSPDSIKKPVTLNEIGKYLKVKFSHTVDCELDELHRQLIVDRMELSLEGEYELPAGWRGKVCMVSKGNRNHSIYDSLVIPAIMPGGTAPIGPIFADVPNDLINSQDDWQVEFHIVDLYDHTECVLRNPIKRRKPTDLAIQLAEMKGKYESQLAEKNKALEKSRENVVASDQANRKMEETINAYADQVEKQKLELEAQEKIRKDWEEKFVERTEKFLETVNQLEKFREELSQSKNEQSRTTQQVRSQELEIENLRSERADITGKLDKLREDVSRLENERDQARRSAEDSKSKIEGLERQLEVSQDVNNQRNWALESENNKVRGLESELKQSQEILTNNKKVINQLNEKLQMLEAQFTTKQKEFAELQENSSKAIVNRDQIEREAKQRIDAYVTQLKIVENERDRAIRQGEEQKGKIEGLERQLEVSQDVNNQRNWALESENNKVRGLESELKQSQEILTDNKKVINQLNEKLQMFEAQFTTKQKELAELQENSSRAIVDRDQIEREAKQRIDAYVTQLKILENERDRAIRQGEEQKGKIEGLERQLEVSQEVYRQRSIELVEETTKFRRLERELKRTTEILARYEKTIEQQQKTVVQLNDELDSAQSMLTQWQLKFERASAGQTLYERYELIRQLRSSDTGEIYKVCDKRFDRVVTLKVLPKTIVSDRRAIRQLVQEAQLLAKLNHPNIVQILDFVATNEPYIVMEYIEGRTFRQVIETDVSLPLDHVIDYIKMICEGLAYAHSQNIYHNNLSPEHLVLTNDEFVKIMDFGMAATIRMTIAHMTGVTSLEMQPYLSPEQMRGEKVDRRSDIYSLGMVFYEMLSGKLPFAGKNIIEQNFNEIPQLIENVPTKVNYILQKCLEKRPEDRYGQVDELRKALREVKV